MPLGESGNAEEIMVSVTTRLCRKTQQLWRLF